MELLLNLAWLLLALPAYWLWRGSRSLPARRKFTALQCLLALGCLLVILFPIISATDDLRAMRAEMEESPTSKRSLSQSIGEKASAGRWHAQPALAIAVTSLVTGSSDWHEASPSWFSPPAAPQVSTPSRAPPRSFLG